MAGVKTVIVNALLDGIPHAVCPCNGVGGSGLSLGLSPGGSTFLSFL